MEIFSEFTFEAAHRLPNVPDGHKCARLHGHSFRVEIRVEGPVGGAAGLGDGLRRDQGRVRAAARQLDHRYLNEVDGPGATRPARTWPAGSGTGSRGRCRWLAGRGPRDLHLGMRLPGGGGVMLADIQAGRDERNLRVDEAGITGIRYPVAVADRERGKQDTIAEVSMSVDLPPGVKGAHLSRFIEVLHETAGEITPQAIPAILEAVRSRLGAASARAGVVLPVLPAPRRAGHRRSSAPGIPGLPRGRNRHGRDPGGGGGAGAGDQCLPMQQGDQRLRGPQPAHGHHHLRAAPRTRKATLQRSGPRTSSRLPRLRRRARCSRC